MHEEEIVQEIKINNNMVLYNNEDMEDDINWFDLSSFDAHCI